MRRLPARTICSENAEKSRLKPLVLSSFWQSFLTCASAAIKKRTVGVNGKAKRTSGLRKPLAVRSPPSVALPEDRAGDYATRSSSRKRQRALPQPPARASELQSQALLQSARGIQATASCGRAGGFARLGFLELKSAHARISDREKE